MKSFLSFQGSRACFFSGLFTGNTCPLRIPFDRPLGHELEAEWLRAAIKILTLALINGMSCKPVHSMVHGKICLYPIKAHHETNLVSIPDWAKTEPAEKIS
jgi:hypothetical protein